jgi:hypothetical protein
MPTEASVLEEKRLALPISATAISGVFILAPPRSFTSIVCAMLGQHPQMYGLPETHLFTCETVRELVGGTLSTSWIRSGLLRAVAQLYFGQQTEDSIRDAAGWLRRRVGFSTGLLFELLVEKVHPLIPVEKSPNVVYRIESMQRIFRMFPRARFIHLLRHPRGHGESNLRYARAEAARGTLPSSHWILCPAGLAPRSPLPKAENEGFAIMDPQRGWFQHNMNICEFLAPIPPEQQIRVRSEELLRNPEHGLRRIATWLGVRIDDEALASMMRPEASPYAYVGPAGAPYGNSRRFLEDPGLHPERAVVHSLEGPLSWRDDGQGFWPEVQELARVFGYQ